MLSSTVGCSSMHGHLLGTHRKPSLEPHAECCGMQAAGYETTANAISFTVYHLSCPENAAALQRFLKASRLLMIRKRDGVGGGLVRSEGKKARHVSAQKTQANADACPSTQPSPFPQSPSLLTHVPQEVDAYGRGAPLPPPVDLATRFPYLEACILEAMRLTPPAPYVFRLAEQVGLHALHMRCPNSPLSLLLLAWWDGPILTGHAC